MTEKKTEGPPPQPQVPDDEGSVLDAFARKYGFPDSKKCWKSLRDSAFPQGKSRGQPNPPLNDGELMTALIMSHQYDLNPWAGQISAFRGQGGRLQVVITIDGWAKILTTSKVMNGFDIEIVWADEEAERPKEVRAKKIPFSATITLYRRDWEHPIILTEYFDECWRDTIPWNTMPARQLRHKVIKEGCRVGLGVAATDEDEARDIIEVDATVADTRALPAPQEGAVLDLAPEKKEAVPVKDETDEVKKVEKDLGGLF